MCVEPLVLDQEYHVLGQQKLTDLRDKIVCAADHVAVGEFSDNPNQQLDILTKASITPCLCCWALLPALEAFCIKCQRQVVHVQ